MAGTIIVDRIESDASYASTINVAGQITFSNTVNFGAFAGTAPVAGFYLPTTNNLAFTTASTERMRINNNGDVGIGTASPSTYSKLTVFGSSVSGFAGITSINGAGSSGSGGIQFGSDGTYVKSAIALVREQANGGGSLVFYNDSNADAANWATTDEKMRIDFAGNVGIGTTSPSSYGFLTLQKYSTSAPPYLVINNRGANNTDTSTYTQGGVLFSAYRDISDPAYIASLTVERTSQSAGASSGGSLVFGTMSVPTTGVPTERMRITPAGYVGISTQTSSLAMLEVRANSDTIPQLFLQQDNTVHGWVLYADRADGFMKFYRRDNAGSTLRVQFNSTGAVTNSTGTYGTISYIRLKENVVDATPKLNAVMQLKVRNYNLIGDDLKQIGFIAQEIEEIFPSLSESEKNYDGTDKEDGIKSVKTSILIPILVKAIQEQQALITALTARITALESK